MNARLRNTATQLIALLAILALLPVGMASAQGAEPPPPVTPFEYGFDPAALGESSVAEMSSPPVGAGFQAGGDRLVAMQRFDGGWGWPLEDLSGSLSPVNTIGPIGMGLAKAYQQTGDPDMYAALQDAAALLLSKSGNYSPSDGYLAAELDAIFGGTTYRDSVNAGFYDLLHAGTYNRAVADPNNPYDTAEYINRIRTSRSGTQANIAAWDIGMGLAAASMAGADPADIDLWIAGTEAEINELDGTQFYDVIGLAGSLYGLAFVGQAFDPTAGQHAAASSLGDLGLILLSYQLDTGGFTWNSLYVIEDDNNEVTEETAYAILALDQLDRGGNLAAIIQASDWLYSAQAWSGTGGWLDWALGDENNEITGEALWALDAGHPADNVWVCESGDCGHPEASYNSIQAGIDNVRPGGNVYVFPGDYDETASNRIILAGTPAQQGPEQYGLFFPINKPGISVIGVDTGGLPFTDANDPNLPYVTTHATNGFGPSNFWVEGADVTIQGLHQGPNASGENKSIEVVADGFTLRYFKSDIPDGSAVYLNDWLYDDVTDTSTVESFQIDHNNFNDGTQVAISSGVGVSGPVGGRVVADNTFDFDPLIDANWPAVSFNGIVPSVAWYIYPVGGAEIHGNSFSGSTSYIRSRGTVEDADFDWAGYWNTNTFDKKVMAGPNPPTTPRAYSYFSGTYEMTNTKIIGAVIQPEIDHAVAGDTVLVGPGTYPERLTIDEGISLDGAGVGVSKIDATSFATAGNVIDITALTGDTTIRDFDILTGDHSNGIHFAGGTDAGGSINILNNHIISTNFGSDQYGIIGGYMDVRAVTITGNEISDTYDNSILAELQMGATTISGNTFNGAFPSVFFMTYDDNDITPLQKVSGNTFDMSLAEPGSGAAGVGVNPSTYYVTTDRREGKYADFEISGNTFTGISDASIKAISIGENSLDGVSGGFDSLQILGNTISGTGGKGIQFFGHVNGALVSNNIMTGLYQGLKMFSYQSSFWPESNDISCNQVVGAADKLVFWDGSGTLTVEDNWWGDVAGPNPTLMSANVDYTPWLPVPTCGGTSTTHLISGNAGIANALLSYDVGTPQSVLANASGEYLLTVPDGWTGTVTPSHAGNSFLPVWRSYTNLTADQADQDFTASAKLFDDVPVTGKEWMQPWVEEFYYDGITTGCGTGPLIYCPEAPVTRAAMAVFILRAEHGPSYVPPPADHYFVDMPVLHKEWMEPWVDQYYREGLTTGCGANPLRYCPENPVTRASMAVFLLRALEGSSYVPPAADHYFDDLPVTGKEWMEPFVDEFYRRGITTGCGASPLTYCPENPVTRASMAVFIERAFHMMP